MHRLPLPVDAALRFIAGAFTKPWPARTWVWLFLAGAAGFGAGRSALDVKQGLPEWAVAVTAIVVSLWVFLDKANPGTSDEDEEAAFKDVVDLTAATAALFTCLSLIGALSSKYGAEKTVIAILVLVGFALVVATLVWLVKSSRAPAATTSP